MMLARKRDRKKLKKTGLYLFVVITAAFVQGEKKVKLEKYVTGCVWPQSAVQQLDTGDSSICQTQIHLNACKIKYKR